MAGGLVVGKRRIKFRFFIFLFLIISAVYFLLPKSEPMNTYAVIGYGEVELAGSGPAIIIRDESVVSAPAYGKAVYIAADGTFVSVDQPVALLYKDSYNQDIMYQLYDIQEKIINYQQNQLLGQVIDSDIVSLDMDIDSLVMDVQTHIKNHQLQPIAQKESSLRKLLSQKQKLLDLRTEPDAYLSGLYEEEADILRQMKDWTVDIVSPESGIISFTLDGYENILSTDSIDRLELADFRQIMSQPPQSVETSGAMAEQPFFRIVDSSGSWFAVLETDNIAEYYNRGDSVKVSFEDTNTLSGKINRIIRDKDSSLIIIEFSEGLDRIINKRITPIHILKTVEGLRIPDKALVKSKGKLGVFVKGKDEDYFIEVAVKARSDGFAVIESISDNQVIRLHDQVKIQN